MNFPARLAGPVCLVVLVGGAAHAQSTAHVFVCRDVNGHTITADRPSPDCANSAIEERTQGGVVVREIPAPLTLEQQRLKAIEDRKRHDAQFQQQEQARKDRALTATYSSDEEIQTARERALTDYKEALKLANQNLMLLLQEREVNNKDAAGYAGKAVPLDLQHRIDANEAAINGVTHSIADNRAGIARVNQRFDSDLDRYRYLEKQQPTH
jgi:hypothetical protein